MDKLSISPPILLLSAPRIAGLLPARITPPPEPAPSRRPASFVYANQSLTTLAPDQYETFFTAACDLLDKALLVFMGEQDDLLLMLAQSRFQQALGHTSSDLDSPFRREQRDMAASVQSIRERYEAEQDRIRRRWEQLQQEEYIRQSHKEAR